MCETAIQVITIEFICIGDIVSFREVMRFLRSRETYLRIACQVTAERRRAAAGGTHKEEVRKSPGFGLVQKIPPDIREYVINSLSYA